MATYRKPVNKQKSAKEFRRNVSRTKAPNVEANHGVGQGPMRGGIRL